MNSRCCWSMDLAANGEARPRKTKSISPVRTNMIDNSHLERRSNTSSPTCECADRVVPEKYTQQSHIESLASVRATPSRHAASTNAPQTVTRHAQGTQIDHFHRT